MQNLAGYEGTFKVFILDRFEENLIFRDRRWRRCWIFQENRCELASRTRKFGRELRLCCTASYWERSRRWGWHVPGTAAELRCLDGKLGRSTWKRIRSRHSPGGVGGKRWRLAERLSVEPDCCWWRLDDLRCRRCCREFHRDFPLQRDSKVLREFVDMLCGRMKLTLATQIW